MEIRIRPAEGADYCRIIDLGTRENWETPSKRPGTYRQVLESSCTLVAEIDGVFAGYARAISDGLVTTFLCELLVEPQFRKKGIATALVNTLHRIFPDTRIDLISDADGFYQKNAFRIVGTGMRRNLPV